MSTAHGLSQPIEFLLVTEMVYVCVTPQPPPPAIANLPALEFNALIGNGRGGTRSASPFDDASSASGHLTGSRPTAAALRASLLDVYASRDSATAPPSSVKNSDNKWLRTRPRRVQQLHEQRYHTQLHQHVQQQRQIQIKQRSYRPDYGRKNKSTVEISGEVYIYLPGEPDAHPTAFSNTTEPCALPNITSIRKVFFEGDATVLEFFGLDKEKRLYDAAIAAATVATTAAASAAAAASATTTTNHDTSSEREPSQTTDTQPKIPLLITSQWMRTRQKRTVDKSAIAGRYHWQFDQSASGGGNPVVMGGNMPIVEQEVWSGWGIRGDGWSSSPIITGSP
eukprot:jgi/Hompol1/6994/HPOL_002401-RA